MLKGISKIISPELLCVLSKMGHGDEIVISDGNFPGESIGAGSGAEVLRADACGVPELLRAILPLFPLDAYDNNVYLMDKTESDRDLNIEISSQSTRTQSPYFLKDLSFTRGQSALMQSL